MNSDIQKLLENVKKGTVSVEDALLELKKEPFKDIGIAKLDFHRKIRQGTSEVIYGEGKTAEQIIKIMQTMKDGGIKTILITRLSEEKAGKITQAGIELDFHKDAGL